MPVEGRFGLRRRARLPVDPLDPQRVCRAIGLQVDSGDESVAIEERQRVVAVDPQVGRDVDLEPIVNLPSLKKGGASSRYAA